MQRAFIIVGLTCFSGAASAQGPDLGALNADFAGKVVFKVDRQHRLVMDHVEDGIRFRQDIAPLQQLDPEGLNYSAEEDGIALKCKSAHPQCITKEIFKLDVVRLTSRVTMPNPVDDPNGERTITHFKELLATVDVAVTRDGHERKNAR